MKIEKIEAWGSYSTDGEGYAEDAFAYFSFSAAAEADLAKRNLGGYGVVRHVNCIRLEDTIYLLEGSEKSIEKITGKFPKFTPIDLYQDYLYQNSWDKTTYYSTEKDLLSLLSDNKHHQIKKIVGLCDDKYLYILSQKEPIEITKFAKSRELAVAHALSKLTKEEKGLLGL